MNGYNFTDRVRRALQMAREEAARLHHEYVGTEHILLGLIRDRDSLATTVLGNLKIDLDRIKQVIEASVKKGDASVVTGPDKPYTTRAKKILELAMMEARELNHAYMGTEHLLLGVLREEGGLAAQVLTDSGLTLEAARAETLRLLSADQVSEEPERLDAGALHMERRVHRGAILVRASELIGELLAHPAPGPIRVREIGTELRTLVDQLARVL